MSCYFRSAIRRSYCHRLMTPANSIFIVESRFRYGFCSIWAVECDCQVSTSNWKWSDSHATFLWWHTLKCHMYEMSMFLPRFRPQIWVDIDVWNVPEFTFEHNRTCMQLKTRWKKIQPVKRSITFTWRQNELLFSQRNTTIVLSSSYDSC